MDRADALGRSVWDLFEVSERQVSQTDSYNLEL